jgi:hypothetical protein
LVDSANEAAIERVVVGTGRACDDTSKLALAYDR